MQENELYKELGKAEFRDYCISLGGSGKFILRLMFAADEREIDGCFKIYAVFWSRAKTSFISPI